MYKDFSINKLSISIIICAVLFGSAFTTVASVKTRFGDISLNSVRLEGKRHLDTLGYFLEVRKLKQEFVATSLLGQKAGFAEAIPVLLYHGVVETADGINVSWSDFKEQMFALKRAGWQTISLSDFYLFMSDKRKLPEKSFLLTFDDGRKDSFYNADPILRALDYKATIFVITKYSIDDKIGSKYYLPKGVLKHMIRSGRWEVQSHSKDAHDFYTIDKNGNKGHFLSNKLWLDLERRLETDKEFVQRIRNDLLVSKNEITSGLSTEVTAFAFPFGDFGQNTPDGHFTENLVVSEALSIYPLVFYQPWPVKGDFLNYPDNRNSSFMVKRIEIDAGLGANDLLQRLADYRPKSLPIHANKFGGEWTHWWGSVSEGATLTLRTTLQEKGAATFLVGSALFKDYDFLTRVNYQASSTISLLLRFKDGDNYLSCNFNGEDIFIEEKLNGQSKEIVSRDHNLILPNRDLWLGARVNGDTLDCLIGDKVAAKATSLNPKLKSGGVGFKLWNPGNELATLTVKEILVAEPKQNSELVSLPSYPIKFPDKELEKEEVKAVDLYVANTDNAVESSAQIVPAIVEQNLVPYEVSGTDLPDVWQSFYGKIFTQDNILHIGAKDPNKASLAILQGSEGWSNYKLSATIDWLKGQSFGLVARYKDSENYASCDYSFDGSYVGLYLMSEGKSVLLGRSPRLPIPISEPWKARKFSVRVNEDRIECLVVDEVILQYSLPGIPKTGGIGFSTWDRDFGNTDIAIKSVVVEEVK